MLTGEIYSCEGTFERLFLGAIFGPRAPHFIAGWRADFKNQQENCQALVYFLEHATRNQLTFNAAAAGRVQPMPILSHFRFIEVPIESCGNASPLRVTLQASAPDILLILLRYGANPRPKDDGANPLTALLDKLLEYESGTYPEQLISCLKILLEADPIVELPFKVEDIWLCVSRVFSGIFLFLFSRISIGSGVRCAWKSMGS